MKLNRNTIFFISKNKVKLTIKKDPLDYKLWVEFIDKHAEELIWYEKTKDGIETRNNISKVPENFKERVLAGLNKKTCYKEFDIKKGYYNINCSFNSIDNWVCINFERKPKLEDLKIFVEMAKHLNALLLKDGRMIIDEEVLTNITLK